VIGACLRTLVLLFLVTVLVFAMDPPSASIPTATLESPFAPGNFADSLRPTLDGVATLLDGYGTWIGNRLQGDWGQSEQTGTAVGRRLIQLGPYSLILCALAAAFAWALARLGGRVSHSKLPGGAPLRRALTAALLASPPAGLALPLLTASWIGPPSPIAGADIVATLSLAIHDPSRLSSLISGLADWLVPALLLSLIPGALGARAHRRERLVGLHHPAVAGARAAGLPERVIHHHYARAPTDRPGAALDGLLPRFGALLSGSLYVETVTDWPGLGAAFVDAAQTGDLPMLQACVLVYAIMFLLIRLGAMLAADRSRHAGGRT